MGARGERIAARLARRLGLELWDGHRLAAELQAAGHPAHLARLAIERSPGLIQGVTSPRAAFREAARSLLLEREQGLLLLGVGGHKLLADTAGAAHLRLVAAWPARVEQAMKDLSQPDRAQVEEILRQSDRRRTAYLRYLYGTDWSDPTEYGLTLRTDGIEMKSLLELCVSAVRRLAARKPAPAAAPAPLPGDVPSEEPGMKRRPHVFAHPSEEAFARFLDFYQIRWEYEPRTFPLEVDEDGNVREAFTPDFYLQNLDLYVELTTMKQSLANRKNQKIRKMRERYPGV